MTIPNLSQAFQGQRVLVTGHTGFKGPWLCHWLKHWGAHVTGYALAPPTCPALFSISNTEARIDEHIEADIRDRDRFREVVARVQPDLILHLAAQTIVRESYEIPVESFDVNVMGTVSVLEAIRELNHPCAMVVVTTDKVYENKEQVWGFRECDSLGERDPYGGSKAAAELAVRSYRHSFFHPLRIAEHGVRLATARAGNVIGGGDWTRDALIVDIIRALQDNAPVPLRNPHALRPWQHVLQALSGYLTLAARLLHSNDPNYCQGWNFGPLPGNELPVHQLTEMFIHEWGEGSWEDASDSNQPHEAHVLRLNIDQAVWQLGWRPHWSVQEAVAHTARWYRAFHDDPARANQVMQNQIEQFTERLAPSEPSVPLSLPATQIPVPPTVTS